MKTIWKFGRSTGGNKNIPLVRLYDEGLIINEGGTWVGADIWWNCIVPKWVSKKARRYIRLWTILPLPGSRIFYCDVRLELCWRKPVRVEIGIQKVVRNREYGQASN